MSVGEITHQQKSVRLAICESARQPDHSRPASVLANVQGDTINNCSKEMHEDKGCIVEGVDGGVCVGSIVFYASCTCSYSIRNC